MGGRKELWNCFEGLLSHVVHHGSLVNAGDGAIGSAGLDAVILALQINLCVLLQGNARPAPLLRAVMDQTILADVEIAAAGVAVPVVRLPANQVLLSFQVPICQLSGGRSKVRPLVETNSVMMAPGSHRIPR